jgi:hypothetical protein
MEEEGQSSVEAGLELDSLSVTPVARKGEKGLFPKIFIPFLCCLFTLLFLIVSPLFLRARVC